MKEQIQKYIESKTNAWAATTLKSEYSRLIAAIPYLTLPAPLLHAELVKIHAPYTVLTTLQRIAKFKDWQGDFSYTAFIKNSAQLFRGKYQRKRVGITFEEARNRLNQIENEGVKKAALLMLTSGLRVHEALKYDGSGSVIGKGSKPRRVYSNITFLGENVKYGQIYRALKAVGLRPHDLRKLAATKLASSGFKEADLLEVMGWSNIQTASYYLQPMLESELSTKLKGALGD